MRLVLGWRCSPRPGSPSTVRTYLASQTYAEEQIRASQEAGFELWLAAGTILRGWAMSEQGKGEEGLVQLREGLRAFSATGAALATPYHLALFAQAYAK